MPRKKPDGIGALLKEAPPPIEDINLMDWFASFGVMSGLNAKEAYDLAEEMLYERQERK